MEFLLQEGPAETTSYMILGYSVIFGAMLAYLVSLVVRAKNLKEDLRTLKEVETQGEQHQK